jgi:hypothetical protein
MEAYLGRPLLTNEVVHHINRDVGDDSLRNLVVMTKSGHSSLHAGDMRFHVHSSMGITYGRGILAYQLCACGAGRYIGDGQISRWCKSSSSWGPK